jgi:hypothetical protein
MRRFRIAAAAVSVAMLLAMVPALGVQAAGPSPSYTVYRADCLYDFSSETYWEAGGTFHSRGVVGHHVNFFLVGGSWVAGGTNVTTAKVDGLLDGSAGTASGTFTVRGSPVGDYDGSWTWGMSAMGNASGQGVGGSAGKHLKVSHLPAAPAGLPVAPGNPCGYGRPPDFGFGYELWSVH